MCFRVLLLLGFLLAGFSSSADAKQLGQQNGDAQRYTLEGTVVDSVSGAAVPGAVVQAVSGPGNLARATRADAAGKFKFSAQPGGFTFLVVMKPGYFFADGEPGSPPPVTVSLAADTSGVIAKIMPEGIIYGRISGEDDEPAEGLQVQLLQQRVDGGRRQRLQIGNAVTDDEGKFRIPELHPGSYFLLVGPQNLTARPQESAEAAAAEFGFAYYPGVGEISSAMPIQITAGKHAEINLRLPYQALFRISGTVAGLSAAPGSRVSIVGPGGQSVGQYPVDAQSGKFLAEGLPGGSYTIMAQSQESAGMLYRASSTVKLNANVSGLRLTMLPGVDISASVHKVTLHVEAATDDNEGQLAESFTRDVFGGEPPRRQRPPTFIGLTAEDVPSQGQYASRPVAPGDDSALLIQGVQPGSYRVHVVPNGPFYVASAKSGSVNLLDENLNVGADATPPPIDVVLRDDGAMLNVNVLRDGKPTPAKVVLLPEGERKMMQEGAADGASAVQFSLLAPGTYRVLALELGSDAEYESPEYQQEHASQWQEVTLSANQNATLSVEMAGNGQP